MLKNLCQLEHQVQNKVCRFICENDTDINIIKEALFQFQKFIGAVEDAAKAQQTEKPIDPVAPLEQSVIDPAPVDPEVNEQA